MAVEACTPGTNTSKCREKDEMGEKGGTAKCEEERKPWCPVMTLPDARRGERE